MIPSTYYSPRHSDTFEVQVIPVESHWACAAGGCTHRVLIGRWNFNCTHFIEAGQGNGRNPEEAYASAVRDIDREEVGGEDEMMLHGCD